MNAIGDDDGPEGDTDAALITPRECPVDGVAHDVPDEGLGVVVENVVVPDQLEGLEGAVIDFVGCGGCEGKSPDVHVRRGGVFLADTLPYAACSLHSASVDT